MVDLDQSDPTIAHKEEKKNCDFSDRRQVFSIIVRVKLKALNLWHCACFFLSELEHDKIVYNNCK